MQPTAQLSDTAAYAGIVLVVGVALFAAVAILIVTHRVGGSRKGAVKDESYESGMPILSDARGRFNVRFYLVAMLFLLFDVEVIFLWPWAVVFYDAAINDQAIGSLGVGKGFLLAEIAVFVGFLVVGYVYELRKGVFRWD